MEVNRKQKWSHALSRNWLFATATRCSILLGVASSGMVESSRLASVPATIIDDTMLTRRYFQEAVKLNPADARTLGFLAGHTVIEGTLHQDERLTREGYFMLLDAIKARPEFNMFTAGYVMSRLPADSPRFQDGVALFNAPNERADTRLIINSEFACMACHQE